MSSTPLVSVPVPCLAGYRVLSRVGSGTYADVYRAVRSADQQQVALKCVHRSRLNATATDNIVTEIAVLKRLTHPNIVQLHDFACDKNYVYIVMELCAGGDLSRLIRARRRLPEALCRRFLRQLTLAVRYMHQKGVSHMDLKPQNLLLTTGSALTLKVADFGFAKYLSADDTEQGLRGSPLYMAPEIIKKRNYTAAADLWSIGVILYECLFGRAPFSSSTVDELINRIRSDQPLELPANVSVSDECRNLLTRLLERNPNRRITFQEYFDHPFVDLEHAPGPESLEKGTRVLEQAVESDSAGDLQRAVDLYMDGVEHLFAAIQHEGSEARRAGLRKRLDEYVRRSEQLRAQLRARRPLSSESAPSAGSGGAPTDAAAAHPQPTAATALDLLAGRVESVRAALQLGRSAGWYERECRWDAALDTYQLAITQLMGRLKYATADESRTLTPLVDRWLSRAETIKSFLDLQQDLVLAPSEDAHRDKNCNLQ